VNGMAWLTGILLVLQPQEGKDVSDECKKALDAFRKAYAGADEAKRVEAVRELGNHRCGSCVSVLSGLLVSEADKVRITTAKVLGTLDDPKAVEAVAGAVLPNKDRHEVLEPLAKALEDLDWEVGATILNLLLKKHDDKDILEALHIIVPVVGKMVSTTSVEPLIKLLEHAENEGKRVRVGGKRYAGNPRLAAKLEIAWLKYSLEKSPEEEFKMRRSELTDAYRNWLKEQHATGKIGKEEFENRLKRLEEEP